MLTDEQVFSFITDCEIADDNIKFLFEHNSLFSNLFFKINDKTLYEF
jgi:hypothetical protein